MEFKKTLQEHLKDAVAARIEKRKAETVEPAIQGLPEKKVSEKTDTRVMI